jgi:uncharacterized glyoxalase superfamily protein PhnB
MTGEDITLSNGAIMGRGGTVNPFAIVRDASGFITFAEEVFDAREVAEARTATPDGKLIHAELLIGDSLLLLADAQDGWRTRPGLFQIWVSDIEALIARAAHRGVEVVTPPTRFYGALTLARIEDAWGNLWWLYQPAPGQPDPRPVWEGGSDTIFRTLDDNMRGVSP